MATVFDWLIFSQLWGFPGGTVVENLPSAAHILKLEQNREISMAPAQGRHANSEAGVSPTPYPGGGRGPGEVGEGAELPA